MPEKTRRGAIPHPTRTPTRTKTRHEKIVMAAKQAQIKTKDKTKARCWWHRLKAERNLQVAISDFDAVGTNNNSYCTLINHQKIPSTSISW